MQIQVQTISAIGEDAIATPIAQPLVTPAEGSVLLIDESGVTALESLIAPDEEEGNSHEPLLSNGQSTTGPGGYDIESNDGEMDHWVMLHKLRMPATSIFLTYLVTLSIFPGFLSEDVQSQALGDWYPILLLFTFAITDYASRWFVIKDQAMLLVSTGRCITAFSCIKQASSNALIHLHRPRLHAEHQTVCNHSELVVHKLW